MVRMRTVRVVTAPAVSLVHALGYLMSDTHLVTHLLIAAERKVGWLPVIMHVLDELLHVRTEVLVQICIIFRGRCVWLATNDDLSLNPRRAIVLLHHMSQLVRQQPLADRGLRCVLPRSKGHVASDGKGMRS